MKDLIETTTTSETPLALWFDPDTQEVGIQYGYVVVSMPVEDFHDVTAALASARERLDA